jgi:phage tail protein X
MKTVRAQQNDTVDLIAFRHYGDSSMVEAILEANPGLARLGIHLPHGTEINLPDRKVTPSRGVNLWD